MIKKLIANVSTKSVPPFFKLFKKSPELKDFSGTCHALFHKLNIAGINLKPIIENPDYELDLDDIPMFDEPFKTFDQRREERNQKNWGGYLQGLSRDRC